MSWYGVANWAHLRLTSASNILFRAMRMDAEGEPTAALLETLSDAEAEARQALDRIRAELGPGVDLNVEWIENLQPGPEGKFRWVVARAEKEERERTAAEGPEGR